MDRKIKHLLKYLELSKSKASNEQDLATDNNFTAQAIIKQGRINALDDVEQKVREIFEV